MEDNTALLWYLLSTIAQWAIGPHQRMDGTITVAEMIEYAKTQASTSSTETPLYLAHQLVQALASPERRGLTDTLEDIESKIGEEPPTREAFFEAVKTMNFQLENGGGDNESFARPARTVRRYLNKLL
jgi:hypothetical protein